MYVAATAPKMQALAGEIADGCLTPSITTPAFVRYTRDNVGADIDIGCTVVASIHESDREAGRDGAREIAGMYLANKFQNIRGSADTLLELAGIGMDELAPVAEAMERGGRLAAKAEVTDSLLDRCKPIAGTPDGLHRGDRGVPRRRLHARHARALGRPPPRPDPPLRRDGPPALPAMSEYDVAGLRRVRGSPAGMTKEAPSTTPRGRVTSRLADRCSMRSACGRVRACSTSHGPGYVAARAPSAEPTSSVVDFSEAMLAFARSRAASVEFEHGDATALPFEDASFDAVDRGLRPSAPGHARAGGRRGCSRALTGRTRRLQRWDVPSRGRWLGVMLDASADVGASSVCRRTAGTARSSGCGRGRVDRAARRRGSRATSSSRWSTSPGLEKATSSGTGSSRAPFGCDCSCRPADGVQRAIRCASTRRWRAYRTGDGFDVAVAVELGVGGPDMTSRSTSDRLVEWASRDRRRRASRATSTRWPS